MEDDSVLDRANSMGPSQSSQQQPSSSQIANIVNNMKDILEVIVDQVLSKLCAMPLCLRMFCKYVYDVCTQSFKGKMTQEQIYGIVGEFIFDKWLLDVCFENLHLYGLTKIFFLGENCKQNLRLLKKVNL